MAEISPELLISIRQFAVDTATEVAKITDDGRGNKGTPNGLLPNAQSIEHFILPGTLSAPPDQQPLSQACCQMTDATLTSAEQVILAAQADTDPKALSLAAATEPPVSALERLHEPDERFVYSRELLETAANAFADADTDAKRADWATEYGVWLCCVAELIDILQANLSG